MGNTPNLVELRESIRHSASHVMADAVKSIFPQAKLAIGPPTEDGFYYDFDLPRPLTQEDLILIEERMRETIASDLPFLRDEINRSAARKMFADQPFKLEIIEEIPDEILSIYSHGEFVDLCQGPHVASTKKIKAFKLLSVAGAYWRGDEKRPMLQRIYGTAFETPGDMEEHLKRLEEALRRDHRKLGKELDLFSVHDESGSGLICWHPKGARVRDIIEGFWKKEHYKAGYELVYSPHIGKASLWQASGHLDFYQDSMYSPIDVEGQQYYLRPMNCPFHILMYKNALKSYRELPLRLAELGTVYRYERSGVLHGLLRVRGFTQDDAHIFCRPDQVEDEVSGV
ncbi:MAG: threonine--tRNA ligase, partial [Dehalococcoidia bacterium]